MKCMVRITGKGTVKGVVKITVMGTVGNMVRNTVRFTVKVRKEILLRVSAVTMYSSSVLWVQ